MEAADLGNVTRFPMMAIVAYHFECGGAFTVCRDSKAMKRYFALLRPFLYGTASKACTKIAHTNLPIPWKFEDW